MLQIQFKFWKKLMIMGELELVLLYVNNMKKKAKRITTDVEIAKKFPLLTQRLSR